MSICWTSWEGGGWSKDDKVYLLEGFLNEFWGGVMYVYEFF